MGRSIYDIYSLDRETRKVEYEAVGIDKVIIDGDTYQNYGQFSFMWEKSYVTQPGRGAGFVISNLNSHATGITGHLYLDFSVMSIDDYRSIIKKDLEKNEFAVTCYDPIYNERITINVYLATQSERAKFRTIANRIMKNDGSFEEWIELVGVDEYTLELIGTNTDIRQVSVIYHLNPPSELGIGDETEGEEDVAKGSEILIGNASTFPDRVFDGYVFNGWSTYKEKKENDGNYIDGTAYTINSDLVLYAQWKKTDERTLTYNYGLSQPMYKNGQPVYTKTVQEGQSIGYLPGYDSSPIVIYNGKEYTPYYSPGWYKTPQIASNSETIKDGTLYWQDTNSMIYLLYKTQYFVLSLNADVDGIVFENQYVQYGASLNLPELYSNKDDVFLGWFVESGEGAGTKFTGTTMPPYGLFLVAKWEKR